MICFLDNELFFHFFSEMRCAHSPACDIATIVFLFGKEGCFARPKGLSNLLSRCLKLI